MYRARIPKRSGGYRVIYKPNWGERRYFWYLLQDLHAAQERLCPNLVVHGFMKRRSPVTNAMMHMGYRHTVSFDMKNFFDTVTQAHMPFHEFKVFIVKEFVENRRIEKGWRDENYTKWGLYDVLPTLFVDGAARQGIPTSPLVANIAAADMDNDMLGLKSECGWFVYTRYADDLSFSFDHEDVIGVLMRRVPEIVAKHNFVLNTKKTEVQHASKRRRHITGVGVGERQVYPTRAVKRRLRAARHQGNLDAADGLESWMALKVPPDYSRAVAENQKEFDKQAAQDADLW